MSEFPDASVLVMVVILLFISIAATMYCVVVCVNEAFRRMLRGFGRTTPGTSRPCTARAASLVQDQAA